MIAETLCSAVSAAGLGIALVTAYRRRFLAAARIAAYALVPVALVMTGVVGWLSDTALSPVAWAGFGVLGLAWVLFAGTRAVERRREGGGRAQSKAAKGSRREAAAAPGASAPSLGPARRPAAGSGSGDEFSDIEAILKKHGI